MAKLKTFLKKHALVAGGIAVIIPLVIIFYLQYRTLKTLGQTLPAYRTQVLNQYLKTVIEELAEFYYENAERVLAVPAKSIDFENGGVIRDSEGCSVSLKAVSKAADHFKQQDFKGAKRYFITVATEREGEARSEVYFYDPSRQQMVMDPQAPELVAINVACASYMVYIRAGTPISPYSVGVDRDWRYRLIVKPVYEEAKESKKPEEPKKILAVAGMVTDQDYIFNTLFPEKIRESSPMLLPAGEGDVLIALRSGGRVMHLYDGQGNKLEVSAKETEIEYESIQQFYYFLTNTRLSIRLKGLTVGQWAKRNFIINLSLWSVMSVLLLAAIAQMLRAASREMRLTQMKADFVSNVSHELRTPVASIRVLAELLNLGRVKDSNKVLEYGGYIEGEGRRLTQLINNILDFSRIESGRKTYNFEQVDVKEIVDETLETFSLQFKRNGFAVDYEPLDGPLPTVVLDPDAIGLALTNLLDNAIKYSKSTKKIYVRLGQKDDIVTIAVTDHGIGIPREEQEKIFDKFYRVSTGLVHDVKGSGLGLSLVKHIIEAHRGKITVESYPDKGSTFTISLPVDGQSDGKRGSKYSGSYTRDAQSGSATA